MSEFIAYIEAAPNWRVVAVVNVVDDVGDLKEVPIAFWGIPIDVACRGVGERHWRALDDKKEPLRVVAYLSPSDTFEEWQERDREHRKMAEAINRRRYP